MNIDDFWKPFEKEIGSFDDLVKVINKITAISQAKDIKFAWRGQVDASWALHSSLYRRSMLTKGAIVDEDELAQREEQILMDLKEWGLHSSHSGGRLSILNQLAILQHYGAPTRLIDISFNAWIGIWFAVEEKHENTVLKHEDRDARLFAIDITDRLINTEADYRQWEDDLHRPWGPRSSTKIEPNAWTTSVFAWKPANLDARIAAQNGAFIFGGVAATTKPDGNKFQFPKGTGGKFWKIDEGREACCLALRPHIYDAVKGGAQSGALYTFRIKADAKPEIREKLRRSFGYNHSTIYPDYTGFANFGASYLKSYK